MKTIRPILVVAVALATAAGLLAPFGANAGCATGYTTCNPSGDANVCQLVVFGGDTNYVCDLDRELAHGAATLEGHWDTTGLEYFAWGTNGNGHDYCCHTSTSINRFQVNGTPAADTISLQGNGYTLTNKGGTNVIGEVHAGDGADVITGSSSTSGNYGDILYGEQYDDEIYCDAGEDYAYGGIGLDYIDGGLGVDHLFGQDHEDQLVGGNGNDEVIGGGANDELNDGADNDTVVGDDGDDVVCGTGGGSDTLSGNAGNDRLWESSGDGGSCGGQAGDQKHDASSSVTGCPGSLLTVKPGFCP